MSRQRIHLDKSSTKDISKVKPRASTGSQAFRPPPSSQTAAIPTPELRAYQSRIVEECERVNTIVVLPTGSGKTIIAAEVIKRLGPPALFLVPTVLLVEQQASALQSWTGLRVAKYHGGLALPASFDVLVATPKAFRTAQHHHHEPVSSRPPLQWLDLRVVIFDEVHHVLKDHPYRKLALSLRRSSTSTRQSTPPPLLSGHCSSPQTTDSLRVVGLTASYTYAVGEAQIKASLRSMCSELLVTNLSTASREELTDSGYYAVGAAAEIKLVPTDLRSSQRVPEGVVPVKDRKPHLMGATFFRRERYGECTAFSRRLMACIREMEKAVSELGGCPSFASPLPPYGKIAPRDWGAYAHKLAREGSKVSDQKRRHVGNSISSDPEQGVCIRCGEYGFGKTYGLVTPLPQFGSVHPMLAELEYWYEALKTLVVSWEEAEDEATIILEMGGCKRQLLAASESVVVGSSEEARAIWPTSVEEAVSAFWAEVPETFPRYEHLKKVLVEKYTSLGGGEGGGGEEQAFRGIIFVRQRVTTHVLAHLIASDPTISSLFRSACLYASSSPATASLSVSRKQTQASIERFRGGLVNLLIATNVAEEGMDIPAANCTIRFDAMEHAVSLVQGRGRARQVGSSFVVLSERADRTTADLEAAEREQLRLVHDFKPLEDGEGLAGQDALLAAQRSRERQARSVLLAERAKLDAGIMSAGVLSTVNLFATKTKVVLEDHWRKGGKGLWECTLIYESSLRELRGVGEAAGKKAAKKKAAEALVTELLAALPTR